MSMRAWERPEAEAEAEDVGASLAGFGVTLLVADVAAEAAFLEQALGFERIRASADFAILRVAGQPLILHRDATYHQNPLLGLLPEAGARGAGVELRVYGVDPDVAWARVEAAGGHSFREPQDRPHGLRECILLSPAGYAWIPGIPSPPAD